MTPRNKALIREKQISIIEKQIEQIVDIAKISNISKEEVMGLFNYIYEEEQLKWKTFWKLKNYLKNMMVLNLKI